MISPHFSLQELIASQTAARWGIDNTPTAAIIDNLKKTAGLLESVREICNAPINISSGYRCPELNRRIGGQINSQHCNGHAADFTVKNIPNDIVMELIITSHIPYDQLIYEFDSWVHISWADKPRKQALRIDKKGTRIYAMEE